MGDWPVDQVTGDDCRRFVISLEEKPLGPKMIHHVCGWQVSVLRHADDRGHRKSVPMKSEMLSKITPSDEDEENMFLTRAEAQSVIKRIKNPKYQDACALLLATGLRPSELRALKVRDVTITETRQVIRVSKAIRQNRETGEYVGPPKSELSDRRVGMPPRRLRCWSSTSRVALATAGYSLVRGKIGWLLRRYLRHSKMR